MKKASLPDRMLARVTTAGQLVGYFSHGRRMFMLPLLVLILVSGLLLILAGGLSYVAPFVYAII